MGLALILIILWETHQPGEVELPQPFHTLKWRQPQTFAGEAQITVEIRYKQKKKK
jgi:hypothetical protein